MGYLTGVIILLLCAGATSFSQCPSMSVSGPTGVTNAGDEMSFQVEVGVVGPQLSYNWTVDKGTITGGQGTSKISVRTVREMGGQNLVATVKVDGLPSGCANTASETGPIAELIICGLSIDSWGRLKPNDERGWLDLFFAEVSNNPNQIGIVVLQITHDEKLDSQNRRIQFILKHARFRKFEKSRIWFALEIGEEARTTLFRMLPEAELPCDRCLILKGEHH